MFTVILHCHVYGLIKLFSMIRFVISYVSVLRADKDNRVAFGWDRQQCDPLGLWTCPFLWGFSFLNRNGGCSPRRLTSTSSVELMRSTAFRQNRPCCLPEDIRLPRSECYHFYAPCWEVMMLWKRPQDLWTIFGVPVNGWMLNRGVPIADQGTPLYGISNLL